MKLKRLLLPLLLTASCSLWGCSARSGAADISTEELAGAFTEADSLSGNLPDTYIEGSDHQYMRMGISFFPYFQKGEEGYYFKYNDFIYALDDIKEEILPLCSRENCLHDKETDSRKREKCNACIPGMDASGLAYCNGWLYYLDPGELKTSPTLYRIHTDGAGKEELYRWQEKGTGINQWIVHRDVLYYMTQTFNEGKENAKDSFAAYAMPLSGSGQFTPKQIYQSPDEGVEVVILGNPTAYGNHVYFTCLGNLEGYDSPADDWIDYKYSKVFEYNILTEETSEICLPDNAPGTSDIQIQTFWNDRLIFSLFDYTKGYLEEGPFYTAGLDGTQAEVLMSAKQGYSLAADGKYLYLSNVNLQGRGEDPGPKLYRVFDDKLNEVDTFTVGDEINYDFPTGLPDRAYDLYVYRDSGEFGIRYWDKSAIGSLNGAEITFTEIPYAGQAD